MGYGDYAFERTRRWFGVGPTFRFRTCFASRGCHAS